ncbi:MAG: hypothetical protein QOF21_379, partial [Actinomycetota bacterium]
RAFIANAKAAFVADGPHPADSAPDELYDWAEDDT